MPQPLASWHDTPTREAIVSFAESAVERLPHEERVAVFDNDGTLWCKKPIPIQLDFILRRFAELAEQDESLRALQPWKAAYELRYLEGAGFTTLIASGGDRDFMRPIASELYGIPPERVIGSSLTLDYGNDGLVVKKGLDVLDDWPVKPVRIWSRIGRRPALA
jgi:hypothetical protein